MERPQLQLTSITVGTDDPHGLAEFYRELLGWQVTGDDPPRGDDPGWAQLKPAAGGTPGPTLNFEGERRFQRPVWPSAEGAQNATQHLDIWVQDLDAATAWAVSIGAVLAEFQPQEDVRVLFDPSGHPFCLFR
jgi:catechol 2,3-dioxygenase-like lactoylglutathione lyase family enzyme